MWGLSGAGYQRAIENHAMLVLKPQREGGGNNIFHRDIPAFLSSLPHSEREAWIAMELICVPEASNLLMRAGSGDAIEGSTVSELGIYGWSLFESGEGETTLQEAEAGWLLRTKVSGSNEGGIAVGISVLDTPLLL